MRLAQAAEAVQTTISLATRDGATQARIQLAPAALGGLQIHLQHTAAGVIARVIADHPEAAQALATHGEELRQSLSQSGTALLRLDISTTGDQHRPAAGGTDGEGSSARSGTGDQDADDAPTGDATTVIHTSTLGSASMALVDVLA